MPTPLSALHSATVRAVSPLQSASRLSTASQTARGSVSAPLAASVGVRAPAAMQVGLPSGAGAGSPVAPAVASLDVPGETHAGEAAPPMPDVPVTPLSAMSTTGGGTGLALKGSTKLLLAVLGGALVLGLALYFITRKRKSNPGEALKKYNEERRKAKKRSKR